MTTLANKGSAIDCVILGHYDLGFSFHEKMLRSKGVTSGDYRNLRMDYITLDQQRMPYLDVLNHLTGQRWHWTEMPQVAPVYLTSFLARSGINAEYGSFFHSKREELKDMLGRDPLVVAITTTLYLTPLVVTEVVKFVRDINPTVCIVVGGPLIDNLSFHLEQADFRLILEEMGADVYVQQQQGEQSLLGLIRCIKQNGDISKVKNCYVKWQGRFVYTGSEPEFSLEPINWDVHRTKDLGPTVQTRTALSCPFRCTFCDYPVRAGKWVPQEISTVEAELFQIQERSDVRNVVFIDDTFNVPVDRFKQILRMIIRNQFTFRWYSYLRCNVVDDELAELMVKSNCGGVFLGIESGDAGILKIMRKATTPDQYLKGIKLLGSAGITTFASLIVGFPGETPESINNTIELLREARPSYYRGEIWFNNPRAPIYKSKDEFEIEGIGYHWRHKTMNWEQACDMVLRLYKEVPESVWLPMYDFDFWILPYLEGKGLTPPQIKEFVSSCNQLLSMELGFTAGASAERVAAENSLREFCKTLSIESDKSAAVC
jgi:radical SAM PhpK family P-methyltransferase